MVVDKLNVNYSGHQINAEPISVPENSPYKARTVHNRILKEETSTIEIWQYEGKTGSWLTEEPYTGTVSGTGKFQVDYNGVEDGDVKYRNTILFHPAQAGTDWFIWYKSVGDIYDANDLNAKVDRITGTEDNLVALDSDGGIKDSGKKADDFEPKIDPKGTAFNKNFGNTTGTVCEGNDSRLSDARTPLSHKNTHITGGSDIIPNAVSGGNSGLMSGSDKQNLDDAVSKKHTQNTDQYLDFGGANQVSASDAKDAVAKKHEHANKTELDTYSATTQNLVYWVDGTNGSDDNDGSSGSPFKTIAKAVSMIPQIVNHTVTINLADGSYSEGITLTGYMGGGEIYILGNGDYPENVVIAGRIYAVGCSVGNIVLNGMETTNTGSEGIYLAYCSSYFTIDHVLCDTTDAINDGLYAIGCPVVYILYSTFSNRSSGISAQVGTTVISVANYGANNDVGLYAEAATIIKVGPQPGGTTNESASYGGQILSSRLAERDSDAVEGNIAEFDSNGNPVDSGIDSSDVATAVSNSHSNSLDHTQNADQYLDYGGSNQVSASDAKDAVSKKHSQNTDQYLDYGGDNQVAVADVKDAVDKKHQVTISTNDPSGGSNGDIWFKYTS